MTAVCAMLARTPCGLALIVSSVAMPAVWILRNSPTCTLAGPPMSCHSNFPSGSCRRKALTEGHKWHAQVHSTRSCPRSANVAECGPAGVPSGSRASNAGCLARTTKSLCGRGTRRDVAGRAPVSACRVRLDLPPPSSVVECERKALSTRSDYPSRGSTGALSLNSVGVAQVGQRTSAVLRYTGKDMGKSDGNTTWVEDTFTSLDSEGFLCGDGTCHTGVPNVRPWRDKTSMGCGPCA
ncbi:hypothetical protein C8Q77DRAFT_854062 [Trametes polyzona]|nr:hypothetical protein C8Q77DRAFT_854062 [Trametes polyzona]